MSLDDATLRALAIELAAVIPPDPQQERESLFAPIPQSPRDRALRRISEIVNLRQWFSEVVRTLDRHQVSYVDDLEDQAVFELRDRMEYYEECVQCCCDPDDAPPAR